MYNVEYIFENTFSFLLYRNIIQDSVKVYHGNIYMMENT